MRSYHLIVMSMLAILLVQGCMEPAIPELANEQASPDQQPLLPEEPVTNSYPAITSLPLTEVSVGELYLYQAKAFDPDLDPLVWSLEVSVAGLAIDPESGLIGGSILEAGNHVLLVKVEDGRGGSDSQSISLNVNDGPIIFSIPAGYTLTGTPYRYQLGAVDPVGLRLTYSLTEGASGMKLDPDSGLLEWTPEMAGDFAIGMVATNTLGKSASQHYTLKVLPIDGVTIVSTPVTEGFVSYPYEYRIASISQTGAAINYLLANAPAGMHIDQQTGVITWTPDAEGTFAIELQALRDNGYIGTQRYNLRIRTLEQMDAIFNDIMSGLFRNLAEANMDVAMQYLTVEAQSRLRPALTDLSPYMDELSASYTAPVRISLHPEMAEYMVRRTVNNDTRVYTVSFLLDFNGEWKINDL